MNNTWASRISRWLIDQRWRLLALGLVLITVSYPVSRLLNFDRSIENMFSADDPLLVPYRQLKRTFVGVDVVVAAYHDAQLMTADGIARVKQLSDLLAQVHGVEAIISLTTTPLGTEIITNETRGPAYLELLEGYNVGTDRQTVAVACVLSASSDSAGRAETVNRLHEIVDTFDREAVLVGGPVMVVEGFRLVEEDGTRLGWIGTLLLSVTIIACFRSLRWVIVPLVVVNGTLLMTKALIVASRLQLSMVSSMLWSIVTVVGIATIIHVAVRFREERARGLAPAEALLATGTLLLAPVAWTCLTDAAGFASLLAAKVGPVRDFGFMMVVGSLLAMLSLALILPGALLLGGKDIDPQYAWGERRLAAALRRLIDGVFRWPKTIALLTLLIVVIAVTGVRHLEVESDFTKNFRESSDIVKSYDFVEKNLGGAGVWDVIVPAPPPERLSYRYMRNLRHLEKRLRSEVEITDEQGNRGPGLTKVLGMVDGMDTVPTPRFVARDVLVRLKHKKLQQQMPYVAKSLYGEDPLKPGSDFTRIMLRAKERQSSAQKQQLISQVTAICREHLPQREETPQAEVTGFFVLLANLIESMLRDQWVTFGIATAAIGLIMSLAFRSPLLALIALLPNIFPILVVTGVMGWLQLKINMGAAMIAAVSMGLSVDSEIHYITMFQRLRKQGATVRDALYAVQHSVGLAVVFSTLSLTVGFGVLCTSDFVPTVYFGGLVTLALWGGLYGNLVFLPLLLRAVIRDEPCDGAANREGPVAGRQD